MTEKILLAHGSGGVIHDIVNEGILSLLGNPILNKLDDSAVFDVKGKVAFTTDSHVVQPIFFRAAISAGCPFAAICQRPLGDGAHPLYLSLALIIEEGLPKEDLKK